MIHPSPRRAAAALALACVALLLPAAGHAAPRPGKAATTFERLAAGPLSGLLDRLAALLHPAKRGSSLDPDGATGDSGSGLDPNGATSEDDRGSGLDPDGSTSDSGSRLDPDGAASEDDRGSGLDPDGRP